MWSAVGSAGLIAWFRVLRHRIEAVQATAVRGSNTAPPLVLLHGYMAKSTMWSPNIAAFARTIGSMPWTSWGQPSKSIPGDPICNAADFVSWLTATLDALHLDRVSLVGMSFGGWLALNSAVAVPQRVRKLVLLSPGGLLPMVRQFSVRGMLMVARPTRLTVNSFFRWLEFTERAYANLLDLVYLAYDDGADAAARRRSRSHLGSGTGSGTGCRHDMCASQHDIVDARVLAFLKKTRPVDRAATAERSVA